MVTIEDTISKAFLKGTYLLMKGEIYWERNGCHGNFI